jgi:MFS transporter, DHA2 family, multidrug resistance protein
LPEKAKAGIGSAMNDVVRELGGTLGVAVLGSIVSTSYASGMDGVTSGLAPEAAEAASDSVRAAHEVAAEAGGSGGAPLVALADQAFVDAMTTAARVAAIVALVGALFAALYLPARARTEPDKVEPEVPEAVAA